MKKTLLAAALALSLAGSALAAQLPNVAILATGWHDCRHSRFQHPSDRIQGR